MVFIRERWFFEKKIIISLFIINSFTVLTGVVKLFYLHQLVFHCIVQSGELCFVFVCVCLLFLPLGPRLLVISIQTAKPLNTSAERPESSDHYLFHFYLFPQDFYFLIHTFKQMTSILFSGFTDQRRSFFHIFYVVSNSITKNLIACDQIVSCIVDDKGFLMIGPTG